jgi:hypothetical protein
MLVIAKGGFNSEMREQSLVKSLAKLPFNEENLETNGNLFGNYS